MASLWGPAGSVAQDGGLVARTQVSPTLRSDSDDGFSFETGLSFGVESATRSQTLSFDATSRFRIDEDETDLRNPRLNFRYGRTARNSSFTLGASAQRTDISSSFLVFNEDLDDGFNDSDLVVDSGTRTNATLSLGLELGREAPIGLDLSVRQQLRIFEDTDDPDLFDTTDTQTNLGLIFRIDPRLTARAALRYGKFETFGDGDDRTRNGAALSAQYAATPTLTLTGGLNYNNTDFSSGRREEGVGGNLSAALERPNGRITASVLTEETQTGRRDRISLARVFEQRSSSLSFSYGFTRTPSGDPNQVFQVNFDRDVTSRTSINLNARQDIAVNSDADDILRLRAFGGLSHAINETSRLSAGLTLLSVENLDTDSDSERVSASVGYSRQLTEDWNLNTRLIWDSSSDDDGTDNSQAVTIGVARSFAWRP